MFYDRSHFIRDVFDSDRSAVGSKGPERGCQAHSLDRLFQGDGKQVLLGSFPSLISSIHSNEHGGFLAETTGRENQGRVLIPLLIDRWPAVWLAMSYILPP
jgi:hypothetical protein